MILLGLVGCMGFDQQTNVSELRVLAIQSEPPELAVSEFLIPGVEKEAVANILIADPLKEGYQWAVWQCTTFGDGCLEAEFFAEDLSAWILLGETTEQEIQLPIQLNPAWIGVLENIEEEGPVGLTGLWVLACAPGQCDLLTQALNGDVDVSRFSNPFDLMVSLPIEKTSLGFKTLYVSQEANEETRLRNPLISPKMNDSIIISSEESTELQFDIELFQRDPDTASIYGYATVGGFDANSLVNNILETLVLEKSLNWYVSEEDSKGDSELFVIVDDGLGGISYWLGNGKVE